MVIYHDTTPVALRSDYASPFASKKLFLYFCQIFVCMGATGLHQLIRVFEYIKLIRVLNPVDKRFNRD